MALIPNDCVLIEEVRTQTRAEGRPCEDPGEDNSLHCVGPQPWHLYAAPTD